MHRSEARYEPNFIDKAWFGMKKTFSNAMMNADMRGLERKLNSIVEKADGYQAQDIVYGDQRFKKLLAEATAEIDEFCKKWPGNSPEDIIEGWPAMRELYLLTIPPDKKKQIANILAFVGVALAVCIALGFLSALVSSSHSHFLHLLNR